MNGFKCSTAGFAKTDIASEDNLKIGRLLAITSASFSDQSESSRVSQGDLNGICFRKSVFDQAVNCGFPNLSAPYPCPLSKSRAVARPAQVPGADCHRKLAAAAPCGLLPGSSAPPLAFARRPHHRDNFRMPTGGCPEYSCQNSLEQKRASQRRPFLFSQTGAGSH